MLFQKGSRWSDTCSTAAAHLGAPHNPLVEIVPHPREKRDTSHAHLSFRGDGELNAKTKSLKYTSSVRIKEDRSAQKGTIEKVQTNICLKFSYQDILDHVLTKYFFVSIITAQCCSFYMTENVLIQLDFFSGVNLSFTYSNRKSTHSVQ